MRVAIITPFFAEPHVTLLRCSDGVAAQEHPCTHIWVGDGATTDLPGQHIALPQPHGDYGDTPRLIGTLSAYAQGFDAVCWLDGDCWLEPDHVALMVEAATRHVASVVTATRTLWRPDNTRLGVCGESNGVNFCDTNCYLVMRDAIPVLCAAWGPKPRHQAVVGDRFVWEAAKTLSRVHCRKPTVNYETKIAAHYLERGEEPPVDARVIVCEANGHFRSRLYRDLVREISSPK